MAEDGVVLRCVGLRKSFGERVAVADVGFQIAAGETYGLLGPNGAGKTTSISMVCGLLTRDAGEVVLDGRPIDTTTVDARAGIGYVPQELAIYPDLTARENLRFFGTLYGLDAAALDARVAGVLEVVELVDRADDLTGEYSGGMKRRLNIGLGLLNAPRLLVLDEPTVGVDPQSRNAILDSVERLGREGMAVLYTTHYMEEAERLCDRVGILDEGKLLAEGTRRELVSLIGERDRVRLSVRGDLDTLAAAARAVPGVVEASPGEGGVDLLVQDAGGSLARIVEAVTTAGGEITGVHIEEPNLETVFLHLTGKALRD
jgi:ABC-2 type transport system ATP-binding protein